MSESDDKKEAIERLLGVVEPGDTVYTIATSPSTCSGDSSRSRFTQDAASFCGHLMRSHDE